MASYLTRTETKTSFTSTSSSRRRRRSSPASMYVPYETSTASSPKPLMKLDKKSKTKSKSEAALHSPIPAPPASLAAPAVPELPHRPLVTSFLGLGRKRASTTASTPPIKFTPPSSTSDGSASLREALFPGGREMFDAEFVPSDEVSDEESTVHPDMDSKGVCEVVKWPSEDDSTTAVGRPDQYIQDGSYSPLHDHNSPSRRVPYRPDTPFIDTIISDSQVLVGGGERAQAQGMKSSVLRTEPREGWEGEWNQNDMQNVISRLRSLK